MCSKPLYQVIMCIKKSYSLVVTLKLCDMQVLQRGDQNIFTLIMVACWYVMAFASGASSCSDPHSLCLHSARTDYLKRNQNTRQGGG